MGICLFIITGRNEVVAKVMFLHVSVILYMAGVSGETPLTRQIPSPPGTRQTPPPPGTKENPLGRENPSPPRTKENPPWTRQTPPRTKENPPSRENPPGTKENPPDQADTPRTKENPLWEEDCSIRSMSGRYPSYWNAFLLSNGFLSDGLSSLLLLEFKMTGQLIGITSVGVTSHKS